MPKGTKVARAESALKAAARKKGLTGARADRYIYGTLNKIKLMRGSRVTRRGASKAKRKR
jgi:hypothetical protein